MSAARHLRESLAVMRGLERELSRITEVGTELGVRLRTGSRLLVVGNGGSAAEAQHLSAELVGRYQRDRRPLSALALHAETSSLTAITNDYGHLEGFARQVEAHGRPGDTLVALSTSGSSQNVLEAVRRAHAVGMWTIGITGPPPSPLAQLVDDLLVAPSDCAYAVQEAHLVMVHLLCEAVDEVVLAELADLGAAIVESPR